MQPQSRVRKFRLNEKSERRRNPRDNRRRITDPPPPGALVIDVPELPLHWPVEHSPAERLLWEIFTGQPL